MEKMDYRLSKIDKIINSRGIMVIFLDQSDFNNKKKEFGQIYFVTFQKKGTIRGNHYHKKCREWFGIVKGKVEIIIEDIKNKERTTIIFDEKTDKYFRLEIGPYIAHKIKSISKYAALLSFTDNEWRRKDTYPYLIPI